VHIRPGAGRQFRRPPLPGRREHSLRQVDACTPLGGVGVPELLFARGTAGGENGFVITYLRIGLQLAGPQSLRNQGLVTFGALIASSQM
jgi:hypothetical protein